MKIKQKEAGIGPFFKKLVLKKNEKRGQGWPIFKVKRLKKLQNLNQSQCDCQPSK